MRTRGPTVIAWAAALAAWPAAVRPAEVAITGELKQWCPVTLTLHGPFAREADSDPNPFTDYRFQVEFRHQSGRPSYRVAGYFAADGHAAETSATEGDRWRARLSPDRPGRWSYRISFARGKHAAVSEAGGEALAPFDGLSGEFTVAPTVLDPGDPTSRGRLEYVGARYLRFAGSGEWFLKAGPDSPENLLAYADFDGTWLTREAGARREGEAALAGLKTWQPHLADWRPGDPTWKGGKGKGLIGALNYLAAKGANAFSFLPYNIGGDGEDVWPFIAPTDKLHYDCSKLDQWGLVFDHATRRGLYLHFKLQETENDDRRLGGGDAAPAEVPASLDGGDLGLERKLYLRELAARFGHALLLNWNLGEENTQSADQERAMASYLRDIDPYRHHIVVHTFPDWQDRVYTRLLGERSALTGASLQNHWDAAHQRTLKWVQASRAAGRPWVVANDEQGDAGLGVPPDPGYAGYDGLAREKGGRTYTLHDIRKRTLWGTLMAGGAGVEYYFGYTLAQNDLGCQDWRSRDRSWDYCRIALDFFSRHVPFWRMDCADELVGNPSGDNSKYCLASPGEAYLVYLPAGGDATLDLGEHSGPFQVRWFNPRAGGDLQRSRVVEVKGPGQAALGPPPSEPEEDWAALVELVPATGMAFPGRDWEDRPPASLGVDPGKLAAAVKWLEEHSGRDGVRELILIRSGYAIWKGDGIDRRHGIWSSTKSFTSTVLGLLIDDARCALETRAARFAPELSARYPLVTLRHLTTMTSGYRAVGDEPRGGYLHGPSSTPFTPSPEPLFLPPGAKYAYWDSAMNFLALVLTRIASEPIEDFFRRRIAEPIGMTGWDWGDDSKDDGIVVNGGSGNGERHVLISARELSRLGHLFLNRGHWNGKQLISASWVRQATSAQVPAALPWAQPESGIDGRGVYGFNWWANGMKPDSSRLWPGAPPGAFCAAGYNNNRLFVIPEWGMVITRLGLDQSDRKIEDRDWSEFLRLVGESILPGSG